MSNKTFKTVKQVQFFKDIKCTEPYGNTKHDLIVFPNCKGQVINTLGGVFGMANKSNKNNINKIVTVSTNNITKNYYYIIVESVKCYFQLLNTNLYDFDVLENSIDYDTIKFVED